MTNAQKWLNREYPKETRKEVTVLNINNRDLEGFLDLSDFSNLIRLDCSNNNLTKLNITSCQQLKKIDCENNHLIDFDYYSLNPNTLVELNIGNNSFTDQDCSVFSKFTNLKWLSINNNKFHGSLRALKKLSKLRKLDVRNTDLDIEVETLPNGLGIISYDNELESNDKEWKNTGQWIVAQWDFVKGGIYIYKCWKRLGFTTFAEIKPWLEAGLKVDEYQETYEWKVRKFTPEQAQEWIKTGVKSSDYEFVVWLRDIKNLDSNWITNYKEDYQILIERFKKYGLCSECNQPNTGDQWCQSCNAFRLKENFSNWTSGKTEIDQFIQNFQLEATGADKFLEWVPYEKFTNIKYLDKGGFGKVYKAKWIGGNIHHWDPKNKQWQREKENYHHCKGWWSREKDHEERFEYKWNWIEKIESCRIVALKSLNNSQNNLDFLSETEKHKIIDDWFNNIVPCYGLSQDPNTENYLMIMQYMPEGNLRHYLSNKNRELTLKDKLSQLTNIAQGLKDIHQKNLVHRDFHSGNILKGIEKTSCLITDLGLCKPVDEVSQEKKIFGVMPYVAPEVLRQQPYTRAADIYSFGIIAYEVLSGLPPYYDKNHDEFLGMQICRGLRPRFQIRIPELLEDLIKKCWDNDLEKRPTANELERILRGWEQGDKEFSRQLQEVEEYNQALPDNIKYPDCKKKIHKGAVYHSKLLPTKEITKLLSASQSTVIDFTNSSSSTTVVDYSTSLKLDFTQLSLEEEIEQVRFKDHQELPPKK